MCGAPPAAQPRWPPRASLRLSALRRDARRASRRARARFDKSKGTSPRGTCVPGYLSSAVFCAVLSTLFAVAVDMSDPWDGMGADDLHFLIDTELEEATRAEAHPINEHTGAQRGWMHACQHRAAALRLTRLRAAGAGEVDFTWHASGPAQRRPLQLRRLANTAGESGYRPGDGAGAAGQPPAGNDGEQLLP